MSTIEQPRNDNYNEADLAPMQSAEVDIVLDDNARATACRIGLWASIKANGLDQTAARALFEEFFPGQPFYLDQQRPIRR